MVSNNVDKVAARELILYAENDHALYQQLGFWKLNYDRKKKRGVYDKKLAVKGLANNYVPMIIRKYKKDFGSFPTVNKATKEYVARNILSNMNEIF